jgi:nucleotide-binding universal stress UspA family protein
MGLGLISDSYHNAAEAVAQKADVPFMRLSPEGKNYSCLIEAMNKGEHDVLFMGALGLGAVAGSTIGTVCERVVRRANMDVFVAKDRRLEIGDGPIVVGMDGSPRSFGGLLTALGIGKKLNVPVHVVAAYDPFYHYVAFNKISTVLDEEAGKVFRFKEQEQLHEELIDDGIAKIYQAHLNVAETVAKDAGVDVICALVTGKPYQAIKKYIEEHKASLLVIGKTGVHADDGLDIGGNTENLLRMVPCHVWISMVEHFPPSDVVAAETIMWSDEASEMINRAPEFVRGIARTGVIRQAQKEGHTFITTRFVSEVMSKMMPGGGGGGDAVAQTFERLEWAKDARAMLEKIADESVRENIGLRAEKSARRDAVDTVGIAHIEPFMAEAALTPGGAKITWRSAPLARLQRVPEAFRDQVKTAIENFARDRRLSVVDGKVEDEAFAASRMAMCPVEPGKE